MAEISKIIQINAPVEEVFDFVANPHNTVKYSPQFNSFVPIGPKERGLGARVQVSGTMMGLQFRTVLQIVEFVENSLIVSNSTEGVKSRSKWEFKPNGKGNTEVRFTSNYSLPGSGLGRLLDKMLIQKDVERTTVASLINLKRLIEGTRNAKANNQGS